MKDSMVDSGWYKGSEKVVYKYLSNKTQVKPFLTE